MNVARPVVSSRPSTATKRREDLPLVQGAGHFVADLVGSDTLHCWFVRSQIAHGILNGVDTTEADDLPGIVGIFTAADLDLPDIPGNTGRASGGEGMARPPLARDRVRHVGDIVAVVVATDARTAEDAAGMTWADIDELDALISVDQAMEDQTLLFPEVGTNFVNRTMLSEGPEPSVSPAIRSTTVVESGRLSPLSIEPLGILVRPEGERLHIICGNQAPHRLANQIAAFSGIPRDQIHITVPDVGGAFGMKGMLFPEYIVMAALARRLERELVWVQTRREQFVAGTHGRGQRHTITLEGDEHGRIERMQVQLVADVGGYPHNGMQVPMFSRLVAAGPYHVPRLEFETLTVVTNLAPTGSYRGAGRPEAALALERAIDDFAAAGGLDPLAVRALNMIKPEALPVTTATGAIYDSGDYPAALRMAAEQIGYDQVRLAQARPRAGHAIGVGFGAFIERAGGAANSGEYAKVELDPVARQVIVRTGSTDTGQGHATVWTDLVGAIFELDDVRFVSKDTDEVADGVGTFASRSAQIGASAATRMAHQVLDEARRRAAESLEAAEADLRYERGIFRVAGSPGAEVSIWDLAEDGGLAADEMFVPGAQTFPYGVHAAVVEVALETGEVTIDRIVAVDDCGTVLNDMIVEGQLHGSLAQGIGQAMYEIMRYNEWGQPMTASLVDYPIPTAGDMPSVTSDRLEHPAPSNPLGAKGTGEAGCIGGPPAILNAVIDALRPLGVTELQLPLRPYTVWRAIQEAANG
jgi:carbon-monoxide dehydrogenase large subunit